MNHDDWDYYPAQLEGHLAVFRLDFAAVEDAPTPSLSQSVRVVVDLKSPDENGLAPVAETEELADLERSWADSLGEMPGARFVGACTTAGRHELFFYAKSGRELEEALPPLLGESAYSETKEVEIKDDPEWSVYLDFLYPTERAVQQIENRRLCEVLAENGDPLDVVRRVDHWVRFNRESSGRLFLGLMAKQGFTVDGENEDAGLFGPDERGKFFARFWREDALAAKGIDALILPLFDLAADNHGRYEGWEAEVMGTKGGAES